jgi:hypothetical protein
MYDRQQKNTKQIKPNNDDDGDDADVAFGGDVFILS